MMRIGMGKTDKTYLLFGSKAYQCVETDFDKVKEGDWVIRERHDEGVTKELVCHKSRSYVATCDERWTGSLSVYKREKGIFHCDQEVRENSPLSKKIEKLFGEK